MPKCAADFRTANAKHCPTGTASRKFSIMTRRSGCKGSQGGETAPPRNRTTARAIQVVRYGHIALVGRRAHRKEPIAATAYQTIIAGGASSLKGTLVGDDGM